MSADGAARNLLGTLPSPTAGGGAGAVLMIQKNKKHAKVQVYDTHLIRWVWQFVRPYQHLFWISAMLMPLNSGFALAQPYVVKLTIDIFLAHRKTAPPDGFRRSSPGSRWPRTAGDGRALPGAGSRRVRDILRPVLPDHDGCAVQPFRSASRLVSTSRKTPDGVLRSHAYRKVSEQDQHRCRCDQRYVRLRFADDFDRFPDLRWHCRNNVPAQSAPRAVGISARFHRSS